MDNSNPGRQPNPPGMPWVAAPPPGGAARPIPLSGAPQPIPLSTPGAAPVPLAGAPMRPVPMQHAPTPPLPGTTPGYGAPSRPQPVAAGPVATGPLPVLRQETPDEGLHNPELEKVVRGAPPYLVSGILHMTVLIALGLWVLATPKDDRLVLEVSYSDEEGEQLDEEAFELAEEAMADDQVITPDNLQPVFDPFQAPEAFELSELASAASSDIVAPQIGMLLKGRTAGMKSSLLKKYGGNATTDDAVKLALGWLARNQQKDGSWSLSGPYAGGSSVENRVAATAMALLAFQGDGHTHKINSRIPFTKNVARGWDYLLKQQDSDGAFSGEGVPSHHRLYTHAQCTIAICELYAMTSDKALLKPAQKAVDYCLLAQGPNGGWRYNRGQNGDTSVTGWFMMALQSAKMGYLNVPDEALEKVSSFLDSVQADGGRRYGYLGPSEVRPSMTAEGLLCRQYLGWEHDDERLLGGIEYLEGFPLSWDDRNAYYWYYAAQVLHHMEGEPWERWNNVMKELLPAKQIKNGGEKGSWEPDGDQWGFQGGRLYVTCLHTYMLEVYYRHLPIYKYRLGQ